MKGVIYARESSDDTEKAPPIENQINIGKSWFQEHKDELLKVYADNGWSGGDWTRPNWNRLVQDARLGQFEFVWVWSRARLARDVEQHAWFYRSLTDLNVKIYANETNDFLDMETMGGYAKEIALSTSNSLLRIQTKEMVRRVYAYKLKEERKRSGKEELENLKGRALWGRTPIPEEIKHEVIRLALSNPDMPIRDIAAQLPKYRLKSKDEDNENAYRKPSLGWVAGIVKAARDVTKPSGMFNNTHQT